MLASGRATLQLPLSRFLSDPEGDEEPIAAQTAGGEDPSRPRRTRWYLREAQRLYENSGRTELRSADLGDSNWRLVGSVNVRRDEASFGWHDPENQEGRLRFSREAANPPFIPEDRFFAQADAQERVLYEVRASSPTGRRTSYLRFETPYRNSRYDEYLCRLLDQDNMICLHRIHVLGEGWEVSSRYLAYTRRPLQRSP